MTWPLRFLIAGYRRLLTHPRYGVWVLLATLAYLINPIDLAPDFIPLLGQIDDGALILLLVAAGMEWLTQRLSPPTPEAVVPPENSPPQTIDVEVVTINQETE